MGGWRCADDGGSGAVALKGTLRTACTAVCGGIDKGVLLRCFACQYLGHAVQKRQLAALFDMHHPVTVSVVPSIPDCLTA